MYYTLQEIIYDVRHLVLPRNGENKEKSFFPAVLATDYLASKSGRTWGAGDNLPPPQTRTWRFSSLKFQQNEESLESFFLWINSGAPQPGKILLAALDNGQLFLSALIYYSFINPFRAVTGVGARAHGKG